MGQIQKGVNFYTGMVVTGDNLNAHVDGAILLPGAITDQAAATAAPSDLVLVSKNGSLKKVTVQSILDNQLARAFAYFEYSYNSNSVTIKNSSNVTQVSVVTAGVAGAIFQVTFTNPFSNIYYNLSGTASIQKNAIAVPVNVSKPTTYPWGDTIYATKIQVSFGQSIETNNQTLIVMVNFTGN